MDIPTRIRRRQRNKTPSLVIDHEMLDPTAHIEEPVDRGPILEQLLDFLDPVFDGNLPGNAYVWGPPGAGKSAIATALVTNLQRIPGKARGVIHTSTRVETPLSPEYVYIDARYETSESTLYRAILDALVEDTVPEKGLGTEYLRERLDDYLGHPNHAALVVVDHVGEPETYPLSQLVDRLSAGDSLSWITIGREEPSSLATSPETCIEVPAYEEHVLVDILAERSSSGLAHRALKHDQSRMLAEWASGNAHDALAALVVAADEADTAGREHVTDADLETGMSAVPWQSVSLGRVLALPANQQTVLYHLPTLDESDRVPVERAAEVIAAIPSVDLSVGTVKRYIYELAEAGIVERVRVEDHDGNGRPPSRVDLRFPARAFRRLYELDSDARE